MRRLIAFLLTLGTALTFVGCTDDATPSEPDRPLTVFVQGTVTGGNGTIRCQDDSFVKDQEGSIVSVRFEFYNEEGERVETRTASPRGTVAVNGLAPGFYRVDQFVTASDTREYGPATYTGIEVL